MLEPCSSLGAYKVGNKGALCGNGL